MTDKRKPRREFTDDEIERIIKAFPDSFVGDRNKALFCLLTLTPLRVHECLGLRVSDVYDGKDINNKFNITRHKKEIVIHISKDLGAVLLKICAKREPESILLEADKKQKSFSRNWAWAIIKQAAEKVGIECNRISPLSCKKAYKRKLQNAEVVVNLSDPKKRKVSESDEKKDS